MIDFYDLLIARRYGWCRKTPCCLSLPRLCDICQRHGICYLHDGIYDAPEGRPGMSDVLPLSGISGLSFDSRFLSPVLFFDSIRRHEAHDTLIDLLHGLCTTLMSSNCSTAFTQSTGSRCIIGGSCHKYNFCRDKSFVTTKRVFAPQKYACRDKIMFVAENICREQGFVATKIFCRDKHNIFVATKAVFCRDKLVLFSTLSLCLSLSVSLCVSCLSSDKQANKEKERKKRNCDSPVAHWPFFYYSFLFIVGRGTTSVYRMWWTFNYWTYFTYLFRSYWNKRETLYSSITACIVSGDSTWEDF